MSSNSSSRKRSKELPDDVLDHMVSFSDARTRSKIAPSSKTFKNANSRERRKNLKKMAKKWKIYRHDKESRNIVNKFWEVYNPGGFTGLRTTDEVMNILSTGWGDPGDDDFFEPIPIEKIKGNRELIMQLVSFDGLELVHASEELRGIPTLE